MRQNRLKFKVVRDGCNPYGVFQQQEHSEGTHMPRSYHHLTRDQRCQLDVLKNRGDSIAEIAATLEVHRSTLYRELDRNTAQRGYKFQQAQEMSFERAKLSTRNSLKMTPELTILIEEKLRLQWSPEQISGWLKRHNLDFAAFVGCLPWLFVLGRSTYGRTGRLFKPGRGF